MMTRYERGAPMATGFGKKVGSYDETTQLGRYVLFVWLDVATSTFTVLVPRSRGEVVDSRRCGTYDPFQGKVLDDVKRAVGKFLRARDVPSFHDVIEYSEVFDDSPRTGTFDEVEFSFDFRVARVQDGDSPQLEIPVRTDEEGRVWPCTDQSLAELEPVRYRHRFSRQVPFTVGRLLKFRAIKASLLRVRDSLHRVLDDGEAPRRVDELDGLNVLGLLS